MNRYPILTTCIFVAIFYLLALIGNSGTAQAANQGGIFPPARLYLLNPSKLAIAQFPTPVGQTGTDWVLTFNDEFDGTALDRIKWRSDYGNGGNGELQEYANDDSHNNYLVQNGILSLVARKENYEGKAYTSGVITTQDRFFQKYGFYEIRARMPVGKGLWPAFWMMPNPTGWPPEIDVMEYLGHEPTIVHMTLHFKKADGSHGSDGSIYSGPDFSADWHTFGVEWGPDAIVWYVDGIEQKRVSDTAKIPNFAMFVLANLAVGGSWPGSPDGTTVFPASYDIDYIRVWNTAEWITPTPTPTNNLIRNASFEDTGANPWFYPWATRNDLNADFTQDATTAVNGMYSFKAALTTKSTTQPWVVALMQKDKSLTSGQTYFLSFWGKASVPRTIKAILQEQNSPYTEYFNQTANLTGSWTRYTYTFTAPTTANTMLNFNLATETGDVWIDEVWLCAGSIDCSLSGDTPTPTPTLLPTATQPPTATPLPPSDTTPPTVTITYPADNSTVKRKSSVTITANAYDEKGIAKVEFLVNGSLLCTDAATPYSCVWKVPGTPNTLYAIEARTYDLSGNSATSSVNVTTRR